MSTTYTPSTSTFHSTITVTSDGDTADHNAFNTAPQQVADNVAYLKAHLSPLISGGTITLGGELVFGGADIVINALVLPVASGSPILVGVDGLTTPKLNATADLTIGDSAYVMLSNFGGNYFSGRVRSPKAVTEGPLSGTNSLSGNSYDHLYVASGHTASSPTWKFDDAPPDGPDGSHPIVRVSNSGSGSVFVENHAGSLLCTVAQSGTGNVSWAILACVGGFWSVIETGPVH